MASIQDALRRYRYELMHEDLHTKDKRKMYALYRKLYNGVPEANLVYTNGYHVHDFFIQQSIQMNKAKRQSVSS